MFGLKTRVANLEFMAAARKAGLLTVAAGDNVVRLLPPLIIEEEHIVAAANASTLLARNSNRSCPRPSERLHDRACENFGAAPFPRSFRASDA